MKRENLFRAIDSDYVVARWDKKTYVIMMLQGKVVFKLINNDEVELDTLHLIGEDNGVHENAKNYEVIAYDEDESSLYFYIAEIGNSI